MEKTTLYLPSEIQRELREQSRRSGRPQAELLREAISGFLAKTPRPLPRSVGAASDGGIRGSESKAWIRSEWSKR